jgi:group I intron endonuclease
MKSGIYRIINSANGKIYIGSSIDLDRRRKQHFVELLKDEHCNSHLQNAYNKYGKENFTFEILEIITDQDNIKQVLLDREQFYIDTLNPEYNICKIAGAFGIEHTLETK